ncbi:thiamine diphosphokinase, partial [Christensenellaceae bacterium OttesenSCG-928-L17]|nr:thiamine diphosphokinase [Christensenellaceae bacterium OttesenSCG-928-L17]
MYQRAIIFAGYHQPGAFLTYTPQANDLILCADAGYALCLQMGVVPHKVLGDFDSIDKTSIPKELLLSYPAEKDDTDTMLCVRYAKEQGCRECMILGGIGGRIDHTIANLQALAFAHQSGMRASMRDGKDMAFLLEKGEQAFAKEENAAISLFAYTERCEGVFISGVKYPLRDAVLTQSFPLGVSNQFASDAARVAVR